MSKKIMTVEFVTREAYSYRGNVEVSGEPSKEALDQLARDLYGEVGGEYYESEGTWTVSSMDLFDADEDDEAPTYRATWTGKKWLIEEL